MVDEIAPSAGASESSPGSAPSPSAPEPVVSQPSIDEIWEKAAGASEDQIETELPPAEEVTETVTEPPSEEETAEEIEAKADAEAKGKEAKVAPEKETEEPIIEPELPPDLKETLKVLEGHPKLAQSYKNRYYALSAYREQFQTPGEARAFREVVPTLDDAKELVRAKEQLDNFDYGYTNDPVGLMHGLYRNSKPQLLNLLAAQPTALANLTDESGQPDHGPFRIASLSFVRSTVANMRAKYGRDEGAMEIIEGFEKLAGLKGEGGEEERDALSDPKVQAIVRENEAHRRREEQGYREAVQSFGESVDEDFRGALAGEMSAFLKPFFQGGAFTDGAREQIGAEIIAFVEDKLEGWAKANLGRLMGSGKLDAAHKENLVKQMLMRARPLLRSAEVKGILKHWSQDILGANRREISRREAIGSRRDVGAGGHTGTGAGRLPVNKEPGKMSPAEKAEYYKQYPTTTDIWGKLNRPGG